MKYTEEEKEVIEEINNFIFEVKIFGITSKDSLFVKYSEFLLKLLDKQQKEIEELNNKYNFEKVAKEEVEELLDDSMPREKIRKKIKEIEDCLKEDCIALHEFQRLAKIDVLKEILGE